MTFEKYGGDKIAVRTHEQYVAQWTSISNAAMQKERILNEWHQAWVGALAQGRAGQLEPNGVVNPKNAIEQTVPAGPVRYYFIRDDDPAHAREVQSLVRRLQRMEVDVYRLSPTFILTAVRAPRRRSPPAPTGSHSSSARSTGYRRC
jgi:hypothetical protein